MRTFAFALVVVAGCGSDAVGIDACRKIESARCEAVQVCPQEIQVDVDACKLSYRDVCLNGIANKAQPTEQQTNECVAAIRALAACTSPETTAASSCPVALSPSATASESACHVLVAAPDHLAACAFVDAQPDAGVDGATSSSASTAASAGGGGAGGAASSSSAGGSGG